MSETRIWTAALVVIGDEILSGRTQDKNVVQIAKWLNVQGIRLAEVRVVADAHFGDVLSVVPVNAVAVAYAPAYQRGPRIIHVPQPGDAKQARITIVRDGLQREITFTEGQPSISTTQASAPGPLM